jgi:hypothetical protein
MACIFTLGSLVVVVVVLERCLLRCGGDWFSLLCWVLGDSPTLSLCLGLSDPFCMVNSGKCGQCKAGVGPEVQVPKLKAGWTSRGISLPIRKNSTKGVNKCNYARPSFLQGPMLCLVAV